MPHSACLLACASSPPSLSFPWPFFQLHLPFHDTAIGLKMLNMCQEVLESLHSLHKSAMHRPHDACKRVQGTNLIWLVVNLLPLRTSWLSRLTQTGRYGKPLRLSALEKNPPMPEARASRSKDPFVLEIIRRIWLLIIASAPPLLPPLSLPVLLPMSPTTAKFNSTCAFRSRNWPVPPVASNPLETLLAPSRSEFYLRPFFLPTQPEAD